MKIEKFLNMSLTFLCWWGLRGRRTPLVKNINNMEMAGPTNNWHYNKKLQPYANQLRKTMTYAEILLWKRVLRAGQMKEFAFRRQRPILDYIVDFMNKDLMLVIEVDGGYHDWDHISEKDLIRRKALEMVGFSLIRFRNEEILNNIESVRIFLEQWIEDWQRKSTP